MDPRNAKKARNSGLFSYLHHFWQVNLAGAEGLSLACRLGCCSPVGSAQHRPRREPRPAQQSATGARSPLGTRFWSGCGRKHQGAGEGRCWTVPAASHKTGGARLVLRGNFGPKREGKPRKSRKYVDENRQRPYNKSAGITPGGASVADRRLATPFTLLQHREGVMRMGHKRGTKALRFTICLVIVLAVAIALAPKAC